MKNQVMTWLQKWLGSHLHTKWFFSMGKTCLFTWECGRFSLEQSANILNSNVCYCCGFHWTVTAQVCVEVISRAVSNAFNHVWTQEGPGDEVISASVCTCIQQCWHKTISRSMCFLMGKSSFQLKGHFTSAPCLETLWNVIILPDMSLAHISLMELSVVFHILKYWGILLHQSWAIEGSWNRCRFSKMVLRLISPWLCAFLNEAFTGHWIGCCSAASPLALSQSSLYLITPGNSLWGIINTCYDNASL